MKNPTHIIFQVNDVELFFDIMHSSREDYNSQDIFLEDAVRKNWDQYDVVAGVSAESLDDVFHITNLWNQPEKVHKFKEMHSLSVGDVIFDNQTKKYNIVARYGFIEVEDMHIRTYTSSEFTKKAYSNV